MKFTAQRAEGSDFLLGEGGNYGHIVNMYVFRSLESLVSQIVVGRAFSVNNFTSSYGTQVTVEAFLFFFYLFRPRKTFAQINNTSNNSSPSY